MRACCLRCRDPVDNGKRVHETPIAEGCGSPWMSYLGKGSAMQMYCALVYSGTMVFQADPSADMFQVLDHIS